MMTQTDRRPRLFDDQGQPVRLGSILGRGGEGWVYEVADRRHLVAKVYRRADPERAEKVAAMLRIRSERLRRLAA